MRGQISIDLKVPVHGVISNVPGQDVPPDAIIGGQNVFVDIDGVLKTRRGYTPVVAVPPAGGERILGIIGYIDANGIFYQVEGSLTMWQALIGGVWTNITGPPNTGDVNYAVRFAVFNQSGQTWIYGVNNVDAMRQWNSTLPAYVTVTSGTPPPFTGSIDIATLNNRVITINTVESAVRYPFRVRWSSINDGTSWPALAFADLQDTSDPLVAIRLTSRTSAVLYRSFSAWYMQAQPGNDASAFSFERIPSADNMNGPASAAGVTVAEGQHYYQGLDGRIYTFDGISVYPISDPIDPIIIPLVNAEFLTKGNSFYNNAKRQVWFFTPNLPNEDPYAGIIYDLRRQAFDTLAVFPDAITASAQVQESTSVTWLTWVGPTDTWLTIPYSSWSSIPQASQLDAWIGTLAGQVHRFFVALTDNGTPIPYSVIGPIIRTDATKKMRFTDIELYMEQAASPEALTVVLQGLLQPYTTPPNIIVNMAVELADQTTFYIPLEPGPLNPRNVVANFVQLLMNSAGSQAGFAFGGGTLFINTELRGSTYSGVQGPD